MFYCQLPCYHLANANPNCLPLLELDAVRLVKRTRNLFSSLCFKKGRSSFFSKILGNDELVYKEIRADGKWSNGPHYIHRYNVGKLCSPRSSL